MYITIIIQCKIVKNLLKNTHFCHQFLLNLDSPLKRHKQRNFIQILNMQQIKRQIQLGNLELARLDNKNQPVPIDYRDLQSTQKTRNNYAKLVSKIKELSSDQKTQWVNIKRLRANQLCKLKKWQQAIDVYLQSMLGIDISEKDEEKLKQMNLEQKYPIMLNLATCNYQLKNYKVAIELCDKVLAERNGTDNLKALYKKAHCLIAAGEINEAHQLARKLLRLKSQEKPGTGKKNDINKQNIVQLIEDIRAKRKNQKEVYQKMFDPKEQEEEEKLMKSQQKSQQQQQIIDYQYGIKQQCVDWCKEAWQNVWSCISRTQSVIRKDQ